MDRLKRIDRRTTWIYWLAAMFVFLIASIGAATMIYRDYNRRINVAGQQAMSLAQTLAEHTTQIFTKLDALSWAISSLDRLLIQLQSLPFQCPSEAHKPYFMKDHFSGGKPE